MGGELCGKIRQIKGHQVFFDGITKLLEGTLDAVGLDQYIGFVRQGRIHNLLQDDQRFTFGSFI